jgi:serine/threonine-protein kinase RsbW
VPSYRLRVSASPESIGQVRDAVAELARRAGISDVWAVKMCLSEAVTNAIVHAYGEDPNQDIDIATAIPEPGTLRVTVSDAGNGFLRSRESAGLGLGLPLVAKLSTLVDIKSRSGGGTVLFMEFNEAEMALRRDADRAADRQRDAAPPDRRVT